MSDIPLITTIIVVANALTAVISSALLMLVFWQNPHSRINQSFALGMVALTAFSVGNILGRFIEEFRLPPESVFYTNNTFYGLMLYAMLWFALYFSVVPSKHRLRIGMVTIPIGVVLVGLMWLGHTDSGITAEGNGNFTTHFNTVGRLMSLYLLAMLGSTAYILYYARRESERAKILWVAPVLIMVGVFWGVLIWRYIQLPVNTLTLAGAAIILGRAVLLEHTFDPLTRLSTELKLKNNELEETNRLKSQFMANMSHELRTPLNSIIGYTDLIVGGIYGDVNQQQIDRLEKVLRNGRHLLGLINDILDLSYIEAGRMALTPEPINTADLLESVLVVMEPDVQKKGLEIIRDFETAPAVFADKIRTRQIFINIIGNAVKFTTEGHIRVRAYPRNRAVCFEIEDTGIGIPTDKQSVVFEEFRQIDSTSTREYGGTGLGMPITKHLVQMSGGDIWFTSQPEMGTTFFVTLPLAQAAGTQTTPDHIQSGNLKVLIVDDSLDAQILLRDTILAAEQSIDVYVASSGREGLRRAREIQPDLITLDVMMPSMDGWQVLQTLHNDSTLKHIPVIVISVIDNHELAHEMGATAIIEKPVDRTNLLDVIKQVADRTIRSG